MTIERTERVFQFLLNEIAIAENEVATYKSNRTSWTSAVAAIGAALVTAFYATITPIDGLDLLILTLLSFVVGIASLAIYVVLSKSISRARKSSSLLYSLILGKDFNLICNTSRADDCFSYILQVIEFRRNIDAKEREYRASLPSDQNIEKMQKRLTKLIGKQFNRNLVDILEELNPLNGPDLDDKTKVSSNSGDDKSQST